MRTPGPGWTKSAVCPTHHLFNSLVKGQDQLNDDCAIHQQRSYSGASPCISDTFSFTASRKCIGARGFRLGVWGRQDDDVEPPETRKAEVGTRCYGGAFGGGAP